MILEVAAAVALGLLLMWMAFGTPEAGPSDVDSSDLDPIEETPRGRALIAIKELEFDRETGKIAADDYRDLKERLSLEAIKVLEADPAPAATLTHRSTVAAPSCPRCGPRPEPDARFCSSCGGQMPMVG